MRLFPSRFALRLLASVTAAAFALAPAAWGRAAGVDVGGPITPVDIMRLHDTRDTQVSPDGRTVLFTVQRQVSTFSPEHSTIWSAPTDGSQPARPFAISAGADGEPRWSPDGRSIAFLSNRKNPLASGADTDAEFKRDAASTPEAPAGTPAEATAPSSPDEPGEPSRQIWLLPAAGGEAIPRTALPNDVSDLAWSPDGRRIAFLSADPATAAEKADKVAKRDWIEVDRVRHVIRLWILDLATRSVRRVSPDAVNVSAMDWSPDGRRLAVRVADTDGINDFFYHSRIAILDPATGRLGAALVEHASQGPKWSPDGRSILTSQILTPGFIGVSPRIYHLDTGRTDRIADGYPGLLSDLSWSPDGGSVMALSFERTRSKLVQIDAAGRVAALAAFDGEATGLTQSRDGRRLAVALSSPDRPADVWVVAGGAPRRVSNVNPQVARWRLGAVREISWRSTRDGRTIYGVLVTPPGYVAGAPIKTVVQIHGGPEWAWWSGWLGSWHEWAQMLATHGYAVLLPNPRGSDGQGAAFARAVGNDWGGADYQDVLDGVDMLVAQHVADPARLGIGGWSYGGFMAAWAVTHGPRFKAAVAGAAPSDLAPFARITDTPDFMLGYFGEVTTHQADYDRASSARRMEGATTPLLVLNGEADTRVPATLGLELYRGLKLRGVPTEMIRYPREPHWFHEPAHQQDVQTRVLSWFDRYL